VSRISCAVLVVLAVLWINACSDKSGIGHSGFAGVDITGAGYAKELNLTDHHGLPRTLADFHGKLVAVFFGYTHCPDVCPTALATMAQAIKLLDSEASRVQVLFVTLDPKRDTKAVLGRYVPAFNPTFLGLYGSDSETRRVAQNFHVFYETRAGSRPGEETLDHTAGTFVFDVGGRVRLFLPPDLSADKIAADLKLLLAGA
jgi:protein SCO1